MAFYDVIGKKISEKRQDVYKYGRNVAESVKLNSMISDEEKYINELCLEIGKEYVSLFRGQYHESLKEKSILVNNSYERIDEYKRLLSEVNKTVICQSCGSKVDNKAVFCSVCGAKIEKPVKEQKRCPSCHYLANENDLFCMNCGLAFSKTEQTKKERRCPCCKTIVKEDMAFCIECGTRLEQTEPSTDITATETRKEKRCPSCSALVAEGMAFCMECGAKVDNLEHIVSVEQKIEQNEDLQESSALLELEKNILLEEQLGTRDTIDVDSATTTALSANKVEKFISSPTKPPHMAYQKEEPILIRPRFCMNCGTKLEEDEIFCIKCGTRYSG